MKILLGMGVVILMGFVYWLFLGGDYDIKNYPSSGTEIVAFGDSLVEGVGATEGMDFVSVLSQSIGVPIVNLGKGGDTTTSGLTRLDRVLDREPKIVILLLGGNDYLRKVSSDTTFANLATMIEAIQDTGAIVLLLGVRGGILSDNYADEYEDLAREYQTAYVSNVLDGVLEHPDLMSDGVHPNNAGYKIIADRIYPVISELLD